MKKILLVDGHSIMNRAFYGLPTLTNSEGIHTNALLGFLNILIKVLDEEKPDYLAVAFDEHAPTFRHKMYEAYKGTRHAMPDELKEQIPIIKELLAAMQVKTVSKEGIEADDILGTLSRRAEKEGIDAVILSGDRDLLQLATESTVKIRLPHTVKGNTVVEDFLAADVLEKYHVTPEGIIELKALMGDSSDNIPGVPKIGEKTATSLIEQYQTIENLREHIPEITKKSIRESLEQNFDLAVLSKKLATIDTEAELDFAFEDALIRDLYTEEAFSLFMRLGFKSLLKHFDRDIQEEKADTKAFREITEESGLRESIEEALSKEFIAVAGDGKTFAWVYSKEEAFFASMDRLSALVEEMLLRLAKKGTVCYTMGAKKLLSSCRVPEELILRDILILEYLNNPLTPARDPFEDVRASAMEAFSVGSRRYLEVKEGGMQELFETVERPLTRVLAEMEKEGIAADREALVRYSKQLGEEIRTLEAEIHADAGEAFNINSPKQLGVILFEKMGLKGGKKTKTGYSTAADVLEKLAPDYPIVAKILEYRTLSKLKGTYTDSLADYIDEGGRIHSTFHQTVTATGRLSSADPNLQNIPIRSERGKELRKVFIPRKGWSFTDADYSQIELRILASLSGDQKLIEAYRQNKDIHAITASQVFHIPFEEVTPLMRRNAKAVNFGIVYGISSFGLSQGLSISRQEAQEYIERYFETYPQVKQYLDGLIASAKKTGYAETYFGRKRPVPELKDPNFMKRSFGERVAMNMPIQGTAADIMKLAMIRTRQAIREEKLASRLVLQVHDELLIETAPGEEEAVKELLKTAMMGACSLAVPLEVDIHNGADFYDAH
ncbi:MAG: DNA polymerase I [Lachnospiraceae bacterium]|nr:DNA polymerase I [Lachnospiraceae bacterium]